MAVMTFVEAQRYANEISSSYELIAELNDFLDLPKSNLTQSYQRSVNKSSGYISGKLSTALTGKRPQEALLVGAVLVVGWLGAKTYDMIRNYMLDISKEEARRDLMQVYSKLTVQKSLLEDKLQECTRALQGRYSATKEKIDEAETRKKQCEEFLRRVQAHQGSINQF